MDLLLLHFSNWGCAIWSVLSCGEGTVHTFWEGWFFRTHYRLENWIERWTSGERIWDTMFQFEERRIPGLPPVQKIVGACGDKVN